MRMTRAAKRDGFSFLKSTTELAIFHALRNINIPLSFGRLIDSDHHSLDDVFGGSGGGVEEGCDRSYIRQATLSRQLAVLYLAQPFLA